MKKVQLIENSKSYEQSVKESVMDISRNSSSSAENVLAQVTGGFFPFFPCFPFFPWFPYYGMDGYGMGGYGMGGYGMGGYY
jgi:hypothetical protein